MSLVSLILDKSFGKHGDPMSIQKGTSAPGIPGPPLYSLHLGDTPLWLRSPVRYSQIFLLTLMSLKWFFVPSILRSYLKAAICPDVATNRLLCFSPLTPLLLNWLEEACRLGISLFWYSASSILAMEFLKVS